jgi:hypothetical protein
MEEGRMTSVALTEQASTARRRMPNRITAVFRLHFVTIATTIAVPWLILAIIFAANYVIWWIIARSVSDPADLADAQEGFSYSGATFYIFVYMMIVAVQAINLTFAFAQGYSVTRRDFYLGTSLAFVALAVMYAAGLTVLSYLEEVTGGWGLGGRMFTSVYYGNGEWYVRFPLFLAIFLFFFFVGAATATVYVRWRSHGMVALFAALTLVLAAAAALVTLTESWGAVGEWFARNGANGVILWSLVPTVVSAAAGYFVLQRATPRN